MAVTDKIKSALDIIVRGFEPRETIWEDMAEEMEYEVEDNVALQPKPAFQNESKVAHFPNNARGHEVIIMEPRTFDDAATIVGYLKDRKTIVINLQLLDNEQSQRTIDFVCGAAHALNGRPQKVGEKVFVFTPSNVALSVELNNVQNKFNDSIWKTPIGLEQ